MGTRNEDYPDGVYRHAENVLVTNSEDQMLVQVQNSYSNKKLTSIDFGDGITYYRSL
jgi:hypothetical protein